MVIYCHGQSQVVKTLDSGFEYSNLFDTGTTFGVACYRIPAMITAPNGDLLAAIDERVPSCSDLRDNRDINIVLRRSTDNGINWLPIETIIDYPEGKSASDPSFILDSATSTILRFFNYMDLDKEKDVYYFKMIKSMDNGRTWSSPIDITKQLTLPDWHGDFKFITSGRGIRTSDGTLLHTIVNLRKGLYLFASDNHGESWNLIDTPIKPADESKVVELDDGTWMVNSRVNDLGTRYVHTSRDRGKTWVSNPDSSLIDPGCNASVVRYSRTGKGSDKNRLLFSNAFSKNGRTNLTVRLSYDEGKTWPISKVIYTQSAAYSSMSVLKDGSLGIFFEKDDYQENVFARFTLDWLTNGKDTYTTGKKTKD